MTVLNALSLGVLQGLTEFLPVSSSGHLIILEHWLKLELNELTLQTFNVLLHAGTLLALFIVYRSQWFNLLKGAVGRHSQGQQLLIQLIIVTIPAAVVGLLFEDFIAYNFSSLKSVGVALLITGVTLIFVERQPAKLTTSQLKLSHLLLIGLAQAAALVPGISRAGMTAGMGRVSGLNRSQALDFAFMMAAPIIAGATVLAVQDLLGGGLAVLPNAVLLVGLVTSTLASLVAILFLRRLVLKFPLSVFSWYLIPLALALAIWG